MGKNLVFLIIFAVVLSPFYGKKAKAETIEELLKKGIKTCNDLFDGERPQEYVFDKKNAYAHVAGGYPTCGCPCSSTTTVFVGAGKQRNQWTYETEGCNQIFKNTSNQDLKKILPLDLLKEFGLNKKAAPSYGVFYVEPTLPQKGTTVSLEIKVTPLGIMEECGSPICLSLPGGSLERKVSLVDYLKEWFKKPEAASMAKVYLEKNKIPEEISKELIEFEVSRYSNRKPSAEKVLKDLKYVQNIYEMSQSLQFSKIDLRWNKKKNQFEIKKKYPIKKKSFKDFFKEQEFESPKC